MNDDEVQQLLGQAIGRVLKNDGWLLEHDLSEQSISHKLAEYLQTLFVGYDVDCEYNGDIDREDNRKRISILKQELKEVGLLREREETDIEIEYTTRAVFPDIIIHKRGTNRNNLCIIEVKKSTSVVPFNYDKIKLRYYTSDYFDNDLQYQLGAFVVFVTATRRPDVKIHYYKKGDSYNIICR